MTTKRGCITHLDAANKSLGGFYAILRGQSEALSAVLVRITQPITPAVRFVG
jgi:hypothetical protein